MDISPQQVRTAEFKSAKRGLDPDEVRTFLESVATELERAQNQSTAMEARARAAVARLQEISEGAGSAAPAPQAETAVQVPDTSVAASVDEAETISRTLLLAQRTADTTLAEAAAEAERIERTAGADAAKVLESTRDTTARMLDEAREEARRAGEAERVTVKTEVESLRARRDFLEADVDHLERHLTEERSRLRDAATTLQELTERVPGGLGEVRRPLLSASHDDTPTGIEAAATDDGPQLDFGGGSHQADESASGAGAESADDLDDTIGLVIQTDIADGDPDGAEQRT